MSFFMHIILREHYFQYCIAYFIWLDSTGLGKVHDTHAEDV